jgi:hypothetical protein
MPVASIELIVFAIQAGIKLAQTGRKVYVEATIGGDLDVPLPPTFQNSPRNLARNYARGLADGDPNAQKRFAEVFDAPLKDSFSEDAAVAADGEWRLVQLYVGDVAAGLVPSFHRGTAEVASLFVLNQWERGKSPFPSAVQRVAGTLVEVAIDYFLHVPGGLTEHSRHGRTLRALLAGLDDVRFQDARWEAIVVGLFTTALDTLALHPDIVTGDADEPSLVRTIVRGVATDVGGRLSDGGFGDLDGEARLKRFGQVVLRSVLKNAGTAIVEDPGILGVEKGGRALVQSVGGGFLSLLLGDDDEPISEALRRVASTESLDRLVRATLRTVVEHPDFFGTGNRAVDAWLRAILTDLYDRRGTGEPFFDAELFADVAYSAIDHGLRDLPTLLEPSGTTPAFVVDVARLVFDTITAPPAAGQPPRFKVRQLSRTDLKLLFDGVFAALATQNDWFARRPHVQTAAATVLPLAIAVLSDLGDGHVKPVLRDGRLSGILVAVLASDLITPSNPPAVAHVVTGVTAVLDAVRAGGASGAGRLLEEPVLLDVLSALAVSGAAKNLFGGDRDKVVAVVARLVPMLLELRRGQVLSVPEMSTRLAAA